MIGWSLSVVDFSYVFLLLRRVFSVLLLLHSHDILFMSRMATSLLARPTPAVPFLPLRYVRLT